MEQQIVEFSSADTVVDFTSSFTTDQLFDSRDDLLGWVRSVGKTLGMVIVISRSDNGKRSGKQFCVLVCEKSGKYKSNVDAGTNSRKCGCQFRLKGKYIKKLGGWILRVMCGTHNHALLTYNEGHPMNSRLTVQEKEVVTRMGNNFIPPKLILNEIKLMRPNDNHTSLKQIYNYRSKQRTSLREGRTEIQQLMHLLDRDKFVYWHRAAPDTNVVKDIFWAHPESIELLNTFPIVLCIDSTYKTNRYKFPLVEIVGVTSTEKTFSVAFAYVHGEKMDNFVWVLEKLKGLFRRPDELPKVILTDRDLAMMNALATVFPTSTNLLCQFHIKKNVRARAKIHVKPMEFVEDIMRAFQRVVHAKSTIEYDLELQDFTRLSAPFPQFLDYVNTTWIDPYKEKFIDLWVNKCMHLGNTTTNRVESAHSQLKMYLRDSTGDLCRCWDSVHAMLRLQHSELKASFEHSLSRVKREHMTKLYRDINGLVSSNAIDHIADEFQKSGAMYNKPALCG